MESTWPKPTPIAMICKDCHADLPVGTTYHRCEHQTRWRTANGMTFYRVETDEPPRATRLLRISD